MLLNLDSKDVELKEPDGDKLLFEFIIFFCFCCNFVILILELHLTWVVNLSLMASLDSFNWLNKVFPCYYISLSSILILLIAAIYVVLSVPWVYYFGDNSSLLDIF